MYSTCNEMIHPTLTVHPLIYMGIQYAFTYTNKMNVHMCTMVHKYKCLVRMKCTFLSITEKHIVTSILHNASDKSPDF